MSDTESLPKVPMTLGDYALAFTLAFFSRKPLANLRVVLGHAWEEVDLVSWFLGSSHEPEREIITAVKFNQTPKQSILYAHRWGVYVAYIPEDLTDQEGEALMAPPRYGMTLFAEEGSHVTLKTGNRRMLDELARLTGRKLVLMPEHAFFIPFTSSSTDADLDVRNYGAFILTRDQAFRRWYVLGD